MPSIRLLFEKGGCITVDLCGSAPETEKCILQMLPWESKLTHSRYCGREVCFAVETPALPPAENQRDRAEKFDVAYWRNWEEPARGLPGSPGAETLSFYYGAETLQFRGTPVRVNIFGRVRKEDEAVLEMVGNRIWKEGFEGIRAELAE